MELVEFKKQLAQALDKLLLSAAPHVKDRLGKDFTFEIDLYDWSKSDHLNPQEIIYLKELSALKHKKIHREELIRYLWRNEGAPVYIVLQITSVNNGYNHVLVTISRRIRPLNEVIVNNEFPFTLRRAIPNFFKKDKKYWLREAYNPNWMDRMKAKIRYWKLNN